MTAYDNLSPVDADTGRINAVIDTPRGSRAKYRYEPESGLFRLAKLLPAGASFPGNFGFIPGTKGGDGDPLDVLILGDGPLIPGIVATLRLIGVLEAEQEDQGERQRNDRLLGVVETRYNPAEIRDIDDLHPHHLDELEHFFTSYNQMEGRQFTVLGRAGAEAALKLVKQHSEAA